MTHSRSVLDGLDAEQREAAQAVRGPVCILAGAGTGKTRAITHRIAYAVGSEAVPAGQLLALTFTARAAGELRTRLRTLGAHGVQARTFHAAALRQLSYFSPRVLGGEMPEVVPNTIRLVANAAARTRLRSDRAEVRDLAAEIDWAKAVLAAPQDYPERALAAGRQPPLTPAVVAQVYAEYEQSKRRAGQLDFADLLLIMAGAIEQHADVAEEIRSRYRHFVVDEYQDVSPLQQRILDAWLGDRDDLCVVGDANQTIYSFAGATPQHLLRFTARFPQAVVVKLERDYRSTPQVVELANRLVASAPTPRSSPQAGSAPISGNGTRLRLIGQRPDGPPPTFTEFDDEPAEAAAVAAACRRLIEQGTPPAEIAVLFRINAQSEVYEQALSGAGVAYVLRGGERFFDRPEIREARLLLRGAARSDDRELPLTETVRGVLAGSGWHPDAPPTGGSARERWESLAALVSLADDLIATNPQAHLVELVEELDQRASAQHAPTVQGVTLSSLHSAKGLEWDAVFLVGLTDTTLPISHATTDDQVAEERRLLYVGITRAREQLALSWALARSPGQRRGRRPSRFLDGLRPASSSAAVEARSKKKAVAVEANDAELFGRLRAWRRIQADAQKVPAFVVFSDATLVAIADVAPTSRSALAAVSGVGPAKLDRYAEPILAVLAGGTPEEVGPVAVS
ncbi:Rep family ATP-dependent DNA helicase [Jatrophihabitans sp. GAS493]|uniref:ATP-dependent helicase n=1 Tax=Jatrophihabitans sp. GAS493 TaxID=1907575 RepID=UPI000BBFDBD0|nr:ATP-dependent DNA helicase UvrD2 [Jatrophihabitans sp. GAS493]SOD73187.1 Rep family ATP-dependent DNA helicase [Jatrophihabitans sp. GAS493]